MSGRQADHGGAPEARSGGGQPPGRQELGAAQPALPAQPEPRGAGKFLESEENEALVLAFQDAPALLAVRLKLPASAALATRFATTRRPDTGTGCNRHALGCLIIAGVLVYNFGGFVFGAFSGDDRPDLPALVEARSQDAGGDGAWSSRLPELAAAYEPTRADLRPWAVRSLLDVPRELGRSGDPAGGWLKPACTAADAAAHARAQALAALLRRAEEVAGTAIILDLPGPEAFAAAAALAGDFEPVVAIDNLPHPRGVVPTAQTLAAAVHWRPLVERARRGRAAGAGPCFVLEGQRLAPYANQADCFDNRSPARLPDAAALARLGVQRVLYVRPGAEPGPEADDLNALLAALPAAGIPVRHLGLASVEPTGEEGPEAGADQRTAAHAWLWLRGAGAQYRAVPRAASVAAGDGGASRREEILGLLRPAPRPSNTGGSRSRSFHFSSGS